MKKLAIICLALFSIQAQARSERVYSCRGYDSAKEDEAFRVNVLWNEKKREFKATYTPTLTLLNTMATFKGLKLYQWGPHITLISEEGGKNFLHLGINIDEKDEFEDAIGFVSRVNARYTFRPNEGPEEEHTVDGVMVCQRGKWR